MRRVLGDFVLGFALVLGLCGFVGCAAKHYESVAVGEFSQKTFSIKKGQVYLLFVSGENLGQNSRANAQNSAQNAIVHFVLTDTLGVPKLKKDFANGRFKSVAFLPPNAEFDELFVQILRQIAAQKGGKIEFKFEDYEVKEL